jgi:hypothetical protein
MNSPDDRFLPSPTWRDPRLKRNFVARCLPLCEGKDAPAVGADDPIERRKLEFVAAYYQINLAYDRLAAASEAKRRASVHKLNSALSARDELEDRYTPIGFLAEPHLDGVLCVDLSFMHAPQAMPEPAPLSAEFSICPPLPIPSKALVQVLDLAGFQQFLAGEATPPVAPDAETHP